MDLLNSLLNNLNQAVILLYSDGKILLYNDVAEKLGKSLLIKPLREGSNLTDLADLGKSLFLRDVIEEIQLEKSTKTYVTDSVSSVKESVSLEFKFVPVINERSDVTYIHLLVSIKDIPDSQSRLPIYLFEN